MMQQNPQFLITQTVTELMVMMMMMTSCQGLLKKIQK